nr:AlpA family phage regulatory protein [Tabrizicola soli]
MLRLPVVQDLTGLGRASIYKAIVERAFPKPVKLGRASAWPESEVRRWIEARKAERCAA